jgi:hypothetical protein
LDLFVVVHWEGYRNVFTPQPLPFRLFQKPFLGVFLILGIVLGMTGPNLVAFQAEASKEKASLWQPEFIVPKAAEITVLSGVQFRVIKPYEFQRDGYRFLHGVALAFHRGRLFASFGHNRGSENSQTEEARWCVSDDDGVTWSDVRTMHSGYGVSHGVFLPHNDRLWAFHGACPNFPTDVYTQAFLFDDEQQRWIDQGKVIGDGFWPMQQPLPMDDGNWIMAGLQCDHGNHAAVAISHGDDFLNWDLVVIPAPTDVEMWGESTVIVLGKKIINISRYGKKTVALLSVSEDYGRTWSECRESNLPMVTSKPYAGTLSSGEHYLIATTTADGGTRRSPLTIALTRPGETLFSRIYTIRLANALNVPGESHANAALSYPYAIEHEGKLYVGYSNNGGNVGRVGEGKQLWNNNSAEMAVIPLQALLMKD